MPETIIVGAGLIGNTPLDLSEEERARRLRHSPNESWPLTSVPDNAAGANT